MRGKEKEKRNQVKKETVGSIMRKMQEPEEDGGG